MTPHRSNSSLAVAAGGLLGFVILTSGILLPKHQGGGLTQIGRHASVAFEDGSVAEMSEPESDLDILRRRRMSGWAGHEFRQTFVLADGQEIEVLNNRPGVESDDELTTGDRLILAAYTRDEKTDPTDGDVVVANLQVDGKDRVVSSETDGKDRVVENVVDGKDKSYIDFKDAKDSAPVFALATEKPALEDGPLDMLLLGGGGYWNDLRTASDTGIINGGGGKITGPGIGKQVPEPTTWAMFGAAGVLWLGVRIWRKRGLMGRLA